MMMMIVAAMIPNIESNIKCPNHKPAGSARPFESCIAWTDERLSLETYNEKNAGYTAYRKLVINRNMADYAQKLTIAAP